MMVQPVSRQGSDPRSAARTHLFLSATLRFGTVSAAIRLRDLSASGARIEGPRLPAVGVVAQISRGALSASGTTIWSDGKGCGVRFDAPLRLDEWMPALASRDQLAVDAMVDQVKSGDADIVPFQPARQPSSPAAPGNPLTRQLAEELAYVGRLLESLGDDLCNEPLVVMRHSEKLQNFDIAAQILGHVAALLVAERPDQALDAIGMTALRDRLQRTSL